MNEAMRGLIQKLGGKKDKSETLLSIFEILLKANNDAAFVLDVQGRLVLHYASKYLKDVPCATTIIAALLLVNKEGARVVDNDECYAITTAGQRYASTRYVPFLVTSMVVSSLEHCDKLLLGCLSVFLTSFITI